MDENLPNPEIAKQMIAAQEALDKQTEGHLMLFKEAESEIAAALEKAIILMAPICHAYRDQGLETPDTEALRVSLQNKSMQLMDAQQAQARFDNRMAARLPAPDPFAAVANPDL